MALFDFLGFNKLPDGVVGSTLVLTDVATLARADAFLNALKAKFHNVALAIITATDIPATAWPAVTIPEDRHAATERLTKTQPQRLIILGLSGAYAPLLEALGCPKFWVNAGDAEVATAHCRLVTTSCQLTDLPDAIVTGDPLASLDNLPQITKDPEICLRFKEQRDSDRWLGYFAATGEGEEELAYALFNRAIRYKMGLMLLAPHAAERCEPVYRESIKYSLQTIRHRRLSTSFVPIKTRVYYIEEAYPLAAFYACADFVIAGATLHTDAKHSADIVTPILHGKPVLVGAAQHTQPLIAAAINAGVILSGSDNDQLFAHLKMLIENPEFGAAIAQRAHAWLTSQVGAAARVLTLID